MPSRRIHIDGAEWRVFPSGFLTANTMDEFGLIFVSGSGNDRVVRVTRYSPRDTNAREHSLALMDEPMLQRLFRMSQPGVRSPEAGYHS